jgi:hypothetical protein
MSVTGTGLIEWWLTPIPKHLRTLAVKAAVDGDYLGFLIKASNENALNLVLGNSANLKQLRIYESTLLHAFMATRTNNRTVSLELLECLFSSANRQRLRAAGQPLPGKGPFTIYRGVAGNGQARRVRGFSWTISLQRAKWYATRLGLPNPAVYQTVVKADAILAYVTARGEDEMIVQLPKSSRPEIILDAKDLYQATVPCSGPHPC